MRDTTIGNIIRNTKILSPEDTIGRAAEALRVSGLEALPVIGEGQVVGMVEESAILGTLNREDPRVVSQLPISSIISPRIVSLDYFTPIHRVAEIMQESGKSVLPVADGYGRYLGIVTRSDITSALCLTIRPPVVAGMATPLGVYLTTGHHRAGAGNLGLFLAGAALMIMNYVASGLVLGTVWLVDQTGLFPYSLTAIMNSPPIGIPNWMDTVRGVLHMAAVPIFLLMLRVLPLSGYHAAEHQVVHAIENGEPLKPATVAKMPRVHPRCGTNIVAGIIVFLMVAEVFSSEVAVLIAVFVLVFAWRVIGGYFQYYVTTKPPTAGQIESGIAAGESLLEQYRRAPGHRVTGLHRIWNTGLPLVMLGAAAVLWIREYLYPGLLGIF